VLRPEAGENVRGFLRRLAEANGHRGAWVFSRALGLSSSFGPESVGRIWRRLAEAAGLLETEVDAMRWSTAERMCLGSTMVVAGTRTVRGFAHPRNARLCPACLRETGILRDFWLFWCVAACPRHRTLLATACVCGRPLLPRGHGRIWECTCGVAAGDLSSAAAPASAVDVARNLAARVGAASGYSCENDLPAPFDALCAHDYMALLHTLGIAAATSVHEDALVLHGKRPNRNGTSEVAPALGVTLARLEAAASIVHGWPDAYTSLLGQVEGRNAAADASKLAGAFATPIGRMLVHPIRGADGLRLRLLSQAFDRYLSERHGGRYRRPQRFLSNDATAKRMHKLFNSEVLARDFNGTQSTPLLRRVVRRVFARLDDRTRVRERSDLARLVRDRAIALHRAALLSMSSKAVRHAVEGTTGKKPLRGWEHPRLLPADPTLHGLRISGTPAYAPEAVEAALARLRSAARRVEWLDGLSPLTSSGLCGKLKRWYTKTDMLLDVFDGHLAVYTAVDAPRLIDLHVDAEDFRRTRSAHSPLNRLAGEFARREGVNVVLQGRFGPAGRLTLPEFQRLARGRLVRWRAETRTRPDSKWPYKATRYNIEDVIAFVQRRLSPEGLQGAEAAAFGRAADVGPLLSALKKSGAALYRMQRELAARGVKAENGATWRSTAIARAIGRMEEGGKVFGVLTGPAFTHGLGPLGPILVPRAPRRRARPSSAPTGLPYREPHPRSPATGKVQPLHSMAPERPDAVVIAKKALHILEQDPT